MAALILLQHGYISIKLLFEGCVLVTQAMHGIQCLGSLSASDYSMTRPHPRKCTLEQQKALHSTKWKMIPNSLFVYFDSGWLAPIPNTAALYWAVATPQAVAKRHAFKGQAGQKLLQVEVEKKERTWRNALARSVAL
eukprot:2878955-Amphidinium_carterae.1